jgi:uncharacterized protein YnzC (UPF0291/DUF896 family)
MEHEKIERISELTRISRERALTQAEQDERAALRQQFLNEFRTNTEATLSCVSVREADGSLRPLCKKADSPEIHP